MGKRDSRSLARGRDRRRTLHIFTGCMLGIILLRLFTLQVVRHDEYARYARDNQLQRERVASPRGYFRDRSGEILVDNVLHFEVVMSWRTRNDVADATNRLASSLPIDTTRVMARYDAWARKHGRRAFPLIPDADKFMISFIRENSERFPELRVVSRARRRYRARSLAAHVFGYVGEAGDVDVRKGSSRQYFPGDMIGKASLELRYEDDLRGLDGQRVLEVNASGTILGEVKELSTPPVAGGHLYLTIDASLQTLLEELLTQSGLPAAGIVMRVQDGAVLAAASVPSYDPNEFATGISQRSLTELFDENTKPMFNRLTQARYPPASTFKIVSTHAILTHRFVNPGEILVYCTGAYRFGNRVFRCWEAAGHGAMNLTSAFVQSCDVYFYKIAEMMDPDILAASAEAFGFGQRTGIDLPGEVAGLVPSRAYYDEKFGKGRWTQGHMLNNIIGQGEYLATIVQMVRMAAAVGNGGYLVTPHLVDHREGQSPVAYPTPRIPGLDGSTLAFLRNAMEGVVANPDGTARWTRLSWLPSAGKTGTAENPHGDAHALYVAYAPVDSPEIAVGVIVENAGHGGEIAAPIVRNLFAQYFGPAPDNAQRRVQPAPPVIPVIGDATP